MEQLKEMKRLVKELGATLQDVGKNTLLMVKDDLVKRGADSIVFFDESMDKWRLRLERVDAKPTPKKIDHSMLVGSKVLCEFSDDCNEWATDFLECIDSDDDLFPLLRSRDMAYYSHVRVAHDYNHAHTGTEQPIPDGYLVECCWYEVVDDILIKRWSSGRIVSDVVTWDSIRLCAYRVVGIAEGWEL